VPSFVLSPYTGGEDVTVILPKTLVLVGMMGSGKSSIGRRLATRLGLPFVDADAEIEAASGVTIEEIFARDGEAKFRDCERRILARLLDQPTHILASGGGAFMDEGTRALIAQRAISVWLRADLDLLMARVGRRGHRPLLKTEDPRAVLAALMARRNPVYSQADLHIDTVDGPPEITVERVLAALTDHLARAPAS